MLFWVIAAGLTAIATLLSLWPLFKGAPRGGASRADHDVEVYGSQLGELESDVERGNLGAAEAELARAEIGRRLLRAAERARRGGASGEGGGRAAMVSAVFVAVTLPLAAIGLYAQFGSAGLPDAPLAARLAPAEGVPGGEMTVLVAQAEERLRAAPEDGRGWDALAPIYLRMQRPDEAVAAFRNAVRLLGSSPAREAGLGEALTQAAGGEVTDEAAGAFERALAGNGDYLPARFFLALDLSQEERHGEAASAWRALIDASPQGAPWLPIANAALADATGKVAGAAAPGEAGGAPIIAAQPGPGADEIAAASQMSGPEREAMIEGMVSQLASRLETAPNDVEGWKRLIRSYTVLGDAERARGALGTAAASFAPGSPEGRQIAELGRELGLDAQGETTTQ